MNIEASSQRLAARYDPSATYSADGFHSQREEPTVTLEDKFVFRNFAEDAVMRRKLKSAAGSKKSKLGSPALFGLLFSLCVGSGYGFEESLGSGGPFLTLVMCNAIPWFWTFPTGLAVAELASSMPSNAGTTAWINAAFHPSISLFNIMITIFMGITANASYAALVANYFERAVLPSPETLPPWAVMVTKAVAMFISTFLNVIGIEIVGGASLVMSILTLSPFIIMTVMGFITVPFASSAMWSVPEDIRWPIFLSIISFNYCNIDSVGSVIEEVQEPKQRTLIRALIPMMFSYYIAYFLPTLVGVSAAVAASPDGKFNADNWAAGYWTHIARLIGGTWLRWVMLAGAVIAGNAYLLTGLCTAGSQFAGMAEQNCFPYRISRIIDRKSRFGTPAVALIVCAVVSLALALGLDFDNLVALQQVFYAGRLALLFLALIKFRFLYPDLPRPFRIPVNNPWILSLLLVPAFSFTVLCVTFGAQLSPTMLWVVLATVPGMYVICAVYVAIFGMAVQGGVVLMTQAEAKEFDTASAAESAEAESAAAEDDDHESADSAKSGVAGKRRPRIEFSATDGEEMSSRK